MLLKNISEITRATISKEGCRITGCFGLQQGPATASVHQYARLLHPVCGYSPWTSMANYDRKLKPEHKQTP